MIARIPVQTDRTRVTPVGDSMTNGLTAFLQPARPTWLINQVMTTDVVAVMQAMFAAATTQHGDICTFCTGHHNIGTVMADCVPAIQDMVGRVTSGRFLLISMWPMDSAPWRYPDGTAYLERMQFNDWMLGTYGDAHYLDAVQVLLDSYDPEDPQDVLDYGWKITPSSKRVDSIHLNSAGKALFRDAVLAKFRSNGWAI